MRYHVLFSKTALKTMEKLDPHVSSLIIGWIRKNLEGCSDPRAHGKPLKGNRKGEWRYRIGNYRVLAEIRDEEVLIYVLEIGHRKEIYEA